MANVEWRFFSRILDVNYTFRALIPDSFEKKPQKILYLLHGLSDDYSSWSRNTSLERYWEKYSKELTVVCPDGGRSFYSDARDGHGGNYESFFTEELFPYVEAHLPAKYSREDRAICGLSMGGYGALRLGLKNPGYFGAIGSFSGAVDSRRYLERPEFSARLWDEDSRLEVIAKDLKPEEFPRIKMLCGTEDFLLEHNRAFDKWLTEAGAAHEYTEFPGHHNWLFWDTHLPEMLAFLTES
ncbi:esterase family protein [bacterium]|nr:esterase family protein [bacterium]